MNEVYETDAFLRIYDASEKKEQEWIDKIKNQLAENLEVGKPLRFPWFREKKFEGKRLYFFTNEKTKRIVLVAFGIKRDQQKIIMFLLVNKERYLKIIS
ncbi:hypothetical protein HY495_02250 [Candidatus Woesearchaeota archaeon]|nr:hypothetical protein [Candidatus Woesearchaeota archaeon]